LPRRPARHRGEPRFAGHDTVLGKVSSMKEVVAIVKPFVAERVLEALKFAPLEACTVREVKGYGRQKSYLDQYGDSEYSLAFLPKVEIQIWVDDARADEVVERIVTVARTGRMGDGKIFVLPATAIV
jgi:nitrogen regulatory protein PII